MAIPLQELLDTGLLFEINRRVLHPLGLSLVFVYEDGCEQVKQVELVGDPDIAGTTFDPATFNQGIQKLQAFMARGGTAMLAAREKALGFIVQETASGHVAEEK